MPKNKSPTAPNLWTQSAMTSIEQPTPVTMVMVTHHWHPPRTSPIADDTTHHQAGRANFPTWDSHCSKCDKIRHWGPKCSSGKPHQLRNASPTGSQHGKSRCSPRSHNCHHGRGGKTDAIDVGEDHSPQEEITLHSI